MYVCLPWLAEFSKNNFDSELKRSLSEVKALTVCSYHVTYAFQSESTLLRTKWLWVRVPLQSLKSINVKGVIVRNKSTHTKSSLSQIFDVISNFIT